MWLVTSNLRSQPASDSNSTVGGERFLVYYVNISFHDEDKNETQDNDEGLIKTLK
jgi:hypothetical protein